MTLPPKQRLAAEAMAAGASLADMARAAGVSPRTVTRWRGDAAFMAAVDAAGAVLAEDARRRVTALAGEAVSALRRAMREGTPSAQVAAAREVLDRVMGKAPAAIEHSGAIDQPGPIEVRFVNPGEVDPG